MDTIVEMAHTANSAKAYKELADFGLDKFIFRNRQDYLNFAEKMEYSHRDVVEISVAKPYNIDLQNIFKSNNQW